MKKRLTVSAFLFVLAGLAGAGAVIKADKDRDGKLDRDEAKGQAVLAKHFDTIDSDKDNKIDQVEIDAHRVMMSDSDNDGRLEKKELRHKGIVKAFDRLDTDKDGALNAEEVLAYFQKKQ